MIVVVKIGGDILRDRLPSHLTFDLKRLHESEGAIVVHGGADIVTEVAQKMGKEQKFVTSPEGFRSRYTDAETLEILMMVMAGSISKRLVSELAEGGVAALGLSGADGKLIRARRKERIIVADKGGRRRVIEGGFTGKIMHVNSALLARLLSDGLLPVISPIALGEKFELLNVDSDRAAAYVAGAVKARSIAFLTDVRGVLVEGSVKQKLTVEEAEQLLPSLSGGMKMKVFAALEALRMGVAEAVIASAFEERCLTKALQHTIGTWIHG